MDRKYKHVYHLSYLSFSLSLSSLPLFRCDGVSIDFSGLAWIIPKEETPVSLSPVFFFFFRDLQCFARDIFLHGRASAYLLFFLP